MLRRVRYNYTNRNPVVRNEFDDGSPIVPDLVPTFVIYPETEGLVVRDIVETGDNRSEKS